MITSLKPEGKNFIGEAKVMDTAGKIVKNLIDEGGIKRIIKRYGFYSTTRWKKSS